MSELPELLNNKKGFIAMICLSCNYHFADSDIGCMLDKKPEDDECFLYEEYDAQLELFLALECSGGDEA